MVTDLVQIRMLGKKKEPENERFRKFLKNNSHSDKTLRRIAQDIEDQIDCTQCANCCKTSTVQLSERDVERLSKFLRITPAQLMAEYTMPPGPLEDHPNLRFTKEQGCVFLDGKLCSVYEARPDICQKYPHLVRGNGSIASRMWSLIDRASVCPISYNALEAFKDELRFRR